MQKNNIIIIILIIVVSSLLITACTSSREPSYDYAQISSDEAKNIMDTQNNYIILDVRTPEEYEQGHISGAILIPDYEISKKAQTLLPDKTQLILVYCRSGNRSKTASKQLASMGYSNIKEFGGIIDWPYDIES